MKKSFLRSVYQDYVTILNLKWKNQKEGEDKMKKKTKKTKHALVVVRPKPVIVRSPQEMISAALAKGSNLETLRELLALQKDWEANEAKKAYTEALTAFKCEVPDIRRDKKNKQYNSTYSSKGNLIKTITPILSKFGLSANFAYENLPENYVKVTCKLTHRLGHKEEVSFSAPADVSGAKNPIQQLKSTTTYLEKITFAGILGIESLEEIDDDGHIGGGIEFIDDKQLSQLFDIIDNSKVNKVKFLAYLKVDKLESLLKTDYQKAIIALQNIVKGGKP